MRAFMLEVPEELLAERRRRGADRWDEVWEGVLHMVPQPTSWHQEFGSDLLEVLKPIGRKLGFKTTYEIAVHRPNTAERDYRTPDITVYHPRHRSKRGVEGAAELAIEILSPDDETHEKLPFYFDVGVREVLVVDPDTRAVELYVSEGGKPAKAAPGTDGSVRSAALGVTFTPAPGPKLRVRCSEGVAEI